MTFDELERGQGLPQLRESADAPIRVNKDQHTPTRAAPKTCSSSRGRRAHNAHDLTAKIHRTNPHSIQQQQQQQSGLCAEVCACEQSTRPDVRRAQKGGKGFCSGGQEMPPSSRIGISTHSLCCTATPRAAAEEHTSPMTLTNNQNRTSFHRNQQQQ